MKNTPITIKKDFKTSSLTTFGVGGEVAFYCLVKNKVGLLTVVKTARRLDIPYLVMAGGSNLVFPDKKINKLLIQIKSDPKAKANITLAMTTPLKGATVKCEAGVSLADLIKFAIKNNLAGLEALSGIPGTVGGAVVGNAGAYGQTISDNLVSVEVFDGQKVRTLKKSACDFGYRNSLLKEKSISDGWIVLSATFKLKVGDRQELLKRSKDIIKTRNKKYPPGLKCPGSFFKNVLVKDISKQALEKIDQSKIVDGKIPAGYLLEEVGAKGMKQGGIYIPDYHGNLLVNDGSGTYQEVLALAKKLKTRVQKHFQIQLEEEVRYML